MALFSDLDWLIVLVVGLLLLFGNNSGTTVRQLGRWYGRALQVKQELVSSFAKAADLPIPADGPSGSLRAVLLGAELDDGARARLRVPLASRGPPLVPPAAGPPSPVLWTGGTPVTSWSATYFGSLPEPREAR